MYENTDNTFNAKAKALQKKFTLAEEKTEKTPKGTKEHAYCRLEQIRVAKEICEFYKSGTTYEWFLARAKAIYKEAYSEFVLFGIIKEKPAEQISDTTVGGKSADKSPIMPDITVEEKDETFEEVLADLEKLVGLKKAKEEIKSLYNLTELMKLREERNLPRIKLPTIHLCFYGPPGTGKTTVARLIARLYKSIGILKTSKMVELDRSLIVGSHIGETEAKFMGFVQQAMNGVLFIDEAYELNVEGSDNDFGTHVIDALLTITENTEKYPLAVVLAGYEDEMSKFMEKNPGLKSRFSNKIHFDNYTPDELYEIYCQFCGGAYHFANDGSEAYFKKLLQLNDERLQLLEKANTPDLNFANARSVRNYFNALCKRQSYRLGNEGLDKIKDMPVEEGNRHLTEFTMEDLKGIPFPPDDM